MYKKESIVHGIDKEVWKSVIGEGSRTWQIPKICLLLVSVTWRNCWIHASQNIITSLSMMGALIFKLLDGGSLIKN